MGSTETNFASQILPPCIAGVCAMTFPTLQPEIGLPLIALLIGLWIHSDFNKFAEAFPFLRRFQTKPLTFQQVCMRVLNVSDWQAEEDDEAFTRFKDEIRNGVLDSNIITSGLPVTGFEFHRHVIDRAEWRNAEFLPDRIIETNEADVLSTGVEIYKNIQFSRRETLNRWPKSNFGQGAVADLVKAKIEMRKKKALNPATARTTPQ